MEDQEQKETEASETEYRTAPPYVIGNIGGDDLQAVAETIIIQSKELNRLDGLKHICEEILARLR